VALEVAELRDGTKVRPPMLKNEQRLISGVIDLCCPIQRIGAGVIARDETLSGAPCNATTTPTTVAAIPTASQNGEPTAIAVGMTLPPVAVSTIPPTVSRNIAQGFSATGPR
jgi:hypothetical protein